MKKSRKPRTIKQFDRKVNPDLSIDEKLKIFANIIVDRLVEGEGIVHGCRP